MLKTLIAAAAVTMMASAAFAGEGEGNPFPYQAPTQPYSLQQYKQAASVSQNPFPFLVPGASVSTDPVVRPLGAAGEVQSEASLPRGFEDGTDLAQNLRHITPSSTQIAQPSIPSSRVHG